MKKTTLLSALLAAVLFLSSCSFIGINTSFWIEFINVDQGDAALIQCDGHYMLIDTGPKKAGKKVSDTLRKCKADILDILVISHPHEDHIGGIEEVLKYSSVRVVFANTYIDNYGLVAKTIIPKEGAEYTLGHAKIEVIYSSSIYENDSLVLLITYGRTKFMFTGDIEDNTIKRITDRYSNDKDKPFKINLMKMPHHGSYEPGLYNFIRTFMPDYAVISVGKNNPYGHPDPNTLSKLRDAKCQVFRTDDDGDILVRSNGLTISVEARR